jgi:phosphatidylserine/phosphatidylglycerophosphate/cardiolipin synthase-like enzyme
MLIMKKTIPLIIFVVLILAATLLNRNLRQSRTLDKLPPVEVFFSPKGGCTDAIVVEIEAAKKTILMQAYSFTSKEIAEALVAAHNRGVDVRAILDSDQETDPNSRADFLLHSGVPTLSDDEHAIAHNKVMVIDDATVITGSFNFTKSAETSNAENLLILRSPELAKVYTENWQSHAAHSRKYEEKPKKEREYSGENKSSQSHRGNSKNAEKEIERAMKKLLN